MEKKRKIAVGIAVILLILAVAAVCFLRNPPDVPDIPDRSGQPAASAADMDVHVSIKIPTEMPEMETNVEEEKHAAMADFQISGAEYTTASGGDESNAPEETSLLMSAMSVLDSTMRGLEQDSGLRQTAADELGEKECDGSFQAEREGMRIYVFASSGADFKGELDKLDASGCSKYGYWLQAVDGNINACIVVR